MSNDSYQKNLNDLMEDMMNKDPKLRMLAELAKRNNSVENTQTPLKEPDNNRTELKMLMLKREYLILVERNNMLASALGACPHCWGTDTTCRCGGQGTVGSRLPDKEAFAELVQPVLDRFGSSMIDQVKENDNN